MDKNLHGSAFHRLLRTLGTLQVFDQQRVQVQKLVKSSGQHSSTFPRTRFNTWTTQELFFFLRPGAWLRGLVETVLQLQSVKEFARYSVNGLYRL